MHLLKGQSHDLLGSPLSGGRRRRTIRRGRGRGTGRPTRKTRKGTRRR